MWPSVVRYLIVIAVICFFTNEANGKSPQKIVHGTRASIKDYPAVVAVSVHKNIHDCGGTLISKRHVLTAAHCVVETHPRLHILDVSQYSVRTGLDTLQKYSKYVDIGVTKINVYKTYKAVISQGGDIAILTLERDIVENENQRPAPLPSRPVGHGVRGTATGWGRTDPDRAVKVFELQKTVLWTIDSDTCRRQYWSKLPYGEICAKGRPGTGICSGDSGGPLFNDYGEVIGVISHTWDCKSNSPSVFTDVFTYKSWIQEVLTYGTSPDSGDFK